MKNVKYLVLGAGPSGLTFANKLKDRGEESFLVIEKESQAGGLCRSMIVDGAPLDIGGGHFLDVRRPEVTEYLFRFMEEDEWNLFTRDSRIQLKDSMVSHPLEANIWQLPLNIQEDYLDAIKKAGCNNGEPMPDKFVAWISWKLGECIANDYMLPYNQKMFADELDELGTYWLEKLPNVDYEDTLRSIEEHQAFGSQPGHAKFYYPKKYGYGEVWLRMADALGEHLICDTSVTRLNVSEREVELSDGTVVKADNIITTIPWNSFEIEGLSEKSLNDITKLKSSKTEIRYVKDNIDAEAQWIYIPDLDKPYHRILNRRVFCPDSHGYWLETRGERVSMYEENDTFSYLNEYAYPLNTIGKIEIMDSLLSEAKENKVYGLGRWGEHSHYNSDVVVKLAMELSEKI